MPSKQYIAANGKQ